MAIDTLAPTRSDDVSSSANAGRERDARESRGVAVAFDTVVISLASATERRAAMTKQFEACPFPWRFFDAVTGEGDGKVVYDSAGAKTFMGWDLSQGEIGCFLSHYGVMKQFVDAPGPDWLLVFEDDVDIDFNFRFDEAVRFCESVGIKYLRLFARRHAAAVLLGNFYYFNLLRYKTTPTGMQAYFVHRDHAKKWVDEISSITKTVDLQIESFWKYRIPIYGIHPYPVIERFTPSTLHRKFREPLTPAERLRSMAGRLSEKMKKIVANRMFHSEDQRLRRLTHEYTEI
ncbi:hypothetical protein GC169_08165 [bacterium]|nr:hypothetical protein [bacterium]